MKHPVSAQELSCTLDAVGSSAGPGSQKEWGPGQNLRDAPVRLLSWLIASLARVYVYIYIYAYI